MTDTAPGWRLPREVPEHGTCARYQRPHKCRCEACTKANRDYVKAWRQRTGYRYVRARGRALAKAGAIFAVENPTEWQQMLDHELERIDLEGSEGIA